MVTPLLENVHNICICLKVAIAGYVEVNYAQKQSFLLVHICSIFEFPRIGCGAKLETHLPSVVVFNAEDRIENLKSFHAKYLGAPTYSV